MKDGLLRVQTFIIPYAVLRETLDFLRHVGTEGFEGFVVWAGNRPDAHTFEFRTSIIPEQRAARTDQGLLVTVQGKALFEVNKALHERGETLAAQVHSHPTDAYHSSTDDTYPLVTLVGALSIVIPHFARNAPQDIDRWAWYRLSLDGHWTPTGDETTVEFV